MLFIYIEVTVCGIIEHLSALRKARAVTRAVPRMLRAVIFERASEMRTPFFAYRTQIFDRLKAVYGKLWLEYTPRGGEHICKFALLTHDRVSLITYYLLFVSLADIIYKKQKNCRSSHLRQIIV